MKRRVSPVVLGRSVARLPRLLELLQVLLVRALVQVLFAVQPRMKLEDGFWPQEILFDHLCYFQESPVLERVREVRVEV